MKVLKSPALLFVLIILIFSCQKEPDSTVVPPTQNASIIGKWELKFVYGSYYKISTNQVILRDSNYIPNEWPGSYFDFKTSEKMYAYMDGSNLIYDYKLVSGNKIDFTEFGGNDKFTAEIQKLQTDILELKVYNINNTDPTIREEDLLYFEKW